MKKVKVEMFEAADGHRFDTEEKCTQYEADRLSLPERLAHHAHSLFAAALCYDGSVEGARTLGSALEEAGRQCAIARIAAGDRKRRAKDKSNGASNVGEGVRKESASGAGTSITDPAHRPTRDNPFPIHAAEAKKAAE